MRGKRRVAGSRDPVQRGPFHPPDDPGSLRDPGPVQRGPFHPPDDPGSLRDPGSPQTEATPTPSRNFCPQELQKAIFFRSSSPRVRGGNMTHSGSVQCPRP